MVTSLGCPFSCGFCEAGGTLYNPRSPETVIKEIEECYCRFNIREIDIFDYEFTAARERVLKICRLIQEKKMDIIWACRSRVDTVNGELLQEMKRAGCNRIYFGLESSNQNILNRVNKGITLRQIRETIGICRDLDIRSLGFFLIGAPGDTRESIKNNLKFAKSLDLDYVQFSKCLAKPLTPLWRQLVQTTGADYWRDWILGKDYDRELPRPWTDLTNKEIDKFAKWAYISYHARPLHILRHLIKLKSFAEFLFSQEKTATDDQKFTAFNENARVSKKRKKRRLLRGLNKHGTIDTKQVLYGGTKK